MSDSPAAGWYEDPNNPMQLRYWNGNEWTSSFSRNRTREKAARKAAASEAKKDRDARRVAAAEATAAAKTEAKGARAAAKVEAVQRAAAVEEAAQAAREEVKRAAEAEAAQIEATVPVSADAERTDVTDGDSETTFVGMEISAKAWGVIQDHCSPDEQPWLVIGSGAAGVLAAFGDRLMIVKTGLLTSFMAGTLGGARITTFPFTDITGIEYNAQMFNGVLEILTASYQGTANKDFWRGSNQSRNANSNDPWTLSNTLPLAKSEYRAALPHLNRVRQLVMEAKQPRIRELNQPAAVSLADEIAKLAALRDSGVLTEAEFVAAKSELLSGKSHQQ